MSSKGLHIAIKDAMKQMGDDIIISPKFLNILSDLSAFSDYPACRTILKDLQQSDDLSKIYKAYKKKGKSCTSEIDKISKSIQKTGKYKKALIAYVFDCFLFAFGAINSVGEPSSSAFDAYSRNDGNAINLDEELNDLKQEYTDLLERLAVKPNDLLHEPAGYYPAMAMNELYLIESKIQIVSDALGSNDKDWCKKKFNDKIAAFKFEKRQACDKELARLKKSYEGILHTALVVPSKGGYISKSAYYDTSKLTVISSVEDEIKRMYQEIGEPYDNWCENKKSSVLAQFKVSPQKRRSQIITRIGIPAAVAAGALWLGGSYVGSKGDIDKFNTDMNKANELIDQGNYKAGLLAYQEAKDGYDGSFFPGSYEGEAEEAIEQTAKTICNDANKLISQNRLVEAKNKLSEIPQEVVAGNQNLAKQVKESEAKISQAVEKAKDVLISNVAKNSGKLDSEGKKLLEDALTIDPDNYWLNIIKNKEK